ncbi:MAG: hypothetical protein ACLP7Q_06980 [Isosphaeraceae bacterium]
MALVNCLSFSFRDGYCPHNVGKLMILMASFSTMFRYAYHVVPLHALKQIGKGKCLLSKSQQQEGIRLRRSTTAGVDEALGFSDYVHFYLPRRTVVEFSDLPILAAQLRESVDAPFPHAVIVVDTQDLKDEECTVCNFNIAVSRPGYGKVKGGNHARGTNPTTILGHWRGFRDSSPSAERVRRSFWHEGLAVPVLTGTQITDGPRSVGFRTRMPELLIRSCYSLRPSDTLYLFSNLDLASLQRMPDALEARVGCSETLAWYAARDRVDQSVRRRIEAYFEHSDVPFPDELNFDRVRARPKQ